MGQADFSLNNPLAARVTPRIPLLRDVAAWIAKHQLTRLHDQTVKALGANPSSGAYKGSDIAAAIVSPSPRVE